MCRQRCNQDNECRSVEFRSPNTCRFFRSQMGQPSQGFRYFAQKDCNQQFGQYNQQYGRQNMDPMCYQPMMTGPCRSNYQRYYFDSNSGRCQSFMYGGCQGNGNNFNSMQECQMRCELLHYGEHISLRDTKRLRQ